MSRTSVEFWGSAVERKGCPKDRIPQIAFVGRSNVGKSSLINALVGRKGMVKTSSAPGKTQTINFFVVNKRCYFVDLPGYGYASVPREVKAKWGPMIEGYILENEDLRGVVVLLDIRHQPTAEDIRLCRWLEGNNIPVIFAVTKADKVSRGQRGQRIRLIASALGVSGDERFYPVSATTGEGKGVLWAVIFSMLEKPVLPAFSA